MMKLFNIIFVISISLPFLYANDAITHFLNSAYEKNSELKSLENSIDIAKEQIVLASKFNNPMLSFGATDVWLSDISNRDSEPMQAYYVGLTQTFPLGDKLKIAEEIAKKDLQLIKYSVEEKKLKFKSTIALYLYSIKILEEKLLLYNKLEENLLNLKSFLNELYKFNKSTQNQILNTDVLISELKIQKLQIYSTLQIQILNLEKITYSKYEDIPISMIVDKKELNYDIDTHPKILALKEEIKKQKKISKLELEKKNSDVNVSLTYFNRDSKYEDYVNIGFSMPLSVYDKENINSKKAKLKSVQIENNLKDLKNSFTNEIKILQTDLNLSYESYMTIKNELLPKLNQIQTNLENYNSFLKINSDEIIKNLNEIIKNEIKLVNEKQKYFEALAKSYYFSKELR